MSSVVTVEIGGQRYPIRSSLDERYVAELAAYVDQKMRAASMSAPASDMLGLAILVSLNIADEVFRSRDQQSSARGDLNDRALRLERMVDDVLAQIHEKKTVSAP
ncbi:MAG: cell division protein ZapA [Acidobacteriota bacterium]